ncbi:unnamed protein product [Caenorhabditis bovis]|uniref:T20D4.11-like domain-containing protein n=1 Tax=Caenorhabditis bovis TaxID=2654633 RepID=A0A8S1EEC1_9PELO|nr:unnamed protein product [Caenorhabditis bovis]
MPTVELQTMKTCLMVTSCICCLCCLIIFLPMIFGGAYFLTALYTIIGIAQMNCTDSELAIAESCQPILWEIANVTATLPPGFAHPDEYADVLAACKEFRSCYAGVICLDKRAETVYHDVACDVYKYSAGDFKECSTKASNLSSSSRAPHRNFSCAPICSKTTDPDASSIF